MMEPQACPWRSISVFTQQTSTKFCCPQGTCPYYVSYTASVTCILESGSDGQTKKEERVTPVTKVSFCDCVTPCLLPCTWRLSCGHGPLGCGAKLLRLFFLALSFHCVGMGESSGMQHPMSSLASSCPHSLCIHLGGLSRLCLPGSYPAGGWT